MPDLEPKGTSEAARSAEACELLVVELQSRRLRLENLLRSVWLEADGVAARRVPIRPRARCGNARIRHIA